MPLAVEGRVPIVLDTGEVLAASQRWPSDNVPIGPGAIEPPLPRCLGETQNHANAL
jgi:hypothetical protein